MKPTRAILFVAATLFVAACTGAPPPVGVAEDAVTVCPGGSVVQGIDVSEFQGSINWTAVKNAGIKFAFIRVSDGTYQDPNFASNWAGAKAAGILRGAYQFFRASDNPQARAYLETLNVNGGGH